jgi:hypothetical protein
VRYEEEDTCMLYEEEDSITICKIDGSGEIL